jgi:hypothetical protein
MCYNMSIITQLRSHKVGPFATFDFIASFIGFHLLYPFVKKYISYERWIYAVVPLSVLIHIVFKIDTPLTAMVMGPFG